MPTSSIFDRSPYLLRSRHARPIAKQGPATRQQRRHQRAQILGQYACPSLHDQCSQSTTASSGSCEFGHLDLGNGQRKRPHRIFQKLPSYVCVCSLTDSCSNETLPIIVSGSGSSTLSSCYLGIHLDPIKHLTNQKQFEHDYFDTIQYWLRTRSDRKCSICFELILTTDDSMTMAHHNHSNKNQFGILEQCQHLFCARCILQWFQQSRQCPVCRQHSNRILISEHFVESRWDKRRLFSKLPKLTSVTATETSPRNLLFADNHLEYLQLYQENGFALTPAELYNLFV